MALNPATRKLLAISLGLAWLGIVAAGICVLGAYAGTPGKTESPAADWPASSLLARSHDRPTLVLFMHPHCPCSRATVGELALLMAHCQGRAAVRVVFIKPSGLPADWVATDTWREAEQIPGVSVERDDDAREARLFGAETSGDALLYDPQGRLLFHGGITLARGHAGDNPGRDALQALLFGLTPENHHTPVYGCSLVECQQGWER